jgi:hypothetical protein
MDIFMTDELQPQRFIPFRKSDVVEMCLAEGRPADSAGSACLEADDRPLNGTAL